MPEYRFLDADAQLKLEEKSQKVSCLTHKLYVKPIFSDLLSPIKSCKTPQEYVYKFPDL
jgi:hypothetical protein